MSPVSFLGYLGFFEALSFFLSTSALLLEKAVVYCMLTAVVRAKRRASDIKINPLRILYKFEI